MLTKITIKLTSAFLGSAKQNVDGIRKLIYVNNKPKLFIHRFNLLCNKYAQELKIGNFDNEHIKVTSYLETNAPVRIEKRKFYKGYKEKEEKFESYSEGALLSFNCYIDESMIPLENAIKIIECIGKYDGISQFGFKWNYGRFEIELVEPITANYV